MAMDPFKHFNIKQSFIAAPSSPKDEDVVAAQHAESDSVKLPKIESVA